eukprot:UN31584
MDQSDEHVVVVHCLGGKGRTGLVSVCLLQYRLRNTKLESLHRHFADMRTNTYLGEKYQGVRNPSQIRWTHYFEKIISEENQYTYLLEAPLVCFKNFQFEGDIFYKNYYWGGNRSSIRLRVTEVKDNFILKSNYVQNET